MFVLVDFFEDSAHTKLCTPSLSSFTTNKSNSYDKKGSESTSSLSSNTLSCISFNYPLTFRRIIDPYFIHCLAHHSIRIEIYAIFNVGIGTIGKGSGIPELIGIGELNIRDILFGNDNDEREKNIIKEKKDEEI